jgi:hypothetical protein
MKDDSKGSPKGTFHARGMQARERGHLPVPEKKPEYVETPVGPVGKDDRGNLQIGSNRPANFG